MDFLVRITAAIARRLALRAGCTPAFADDLFAAAPLHDLGKVAVPDSILLKAGPLDPLERQIIEKHTEMGAAILAGHRSHLLRTAREIALCHHEKWDGSGYPRGLAGPAIPLTARIVAIADVFDALLSRRPYKEPWQPDAVYRHLAVERGRHFDPLLLDRFLADFGGMLSLRAEVTSVFLAE